MPMPTVVSPGQWPYVCGHAIPADADQCDCGLRQAYPRQLEFDYGLPTWRDYLEGKVPL